MDSKKTIQKDLQNVEKVICNRDNMTITNKKMIDKIALKIISYKYYWYSKEDYKFSELFISNLVIALSLLTGKDKSAFYMYLRTSIESFYNSVNLRIDESDEVNGYFKSKKKFLNLISTQKNFKFSVQSDTLNDIYGNLSELIHGTTSSKDSLIRYILEYLNTDDFANPKELSKALNIFDKLTDIFTDFFLHSPSFKDILTNSFYRKKELLTYFKENTK